MKTETVVTFVVAGTLDASKFDPKALMSELTDRVTKSNVILTEYGDEVINEKVFGAQRKNQPLEMSTGVRKLITYSL